MCVLACRIVMFVCGLFTAQVGNCVVVSRCECVCVCVGTAEKSD